MTEARTNFADETLQERERRLQIIIDTTPALISYIDHDYRYQLVNRQYQRWFGRTTDEIIGRSVKEVLGETAFEVLQPHMEAVLRGETVHFEAETPYRDGGTRWIDAHYVPDRSADGRIQGFFVFVLDASERKRAEAALIDSDRRKDEFLAVLAHELRNPLAPLRSALQILQLSSEANPAAQRICEMMERQVNHIVRLVDDLLEVSRVNRGKIELRKQILDLHRIVDGAVEASRPLIEADRHDLVVDVAAEPLRVDGDPVRLTQVIANLLNNAAKYTEAGGHIALTVRRDGHSAVITVRDSGVGIPLEMVPRVFDLFTQLDGHAGRAQGGIGIGLWLVRNLVDLHGGRITVHSDGIGRGSEFVVQLPLSAGIPGVVEESEEPAPQTLAAHRVLIVDDNRDAAQSLGTLLELLGATVHVSFNGADAVETFAVHKPGVVLLDIGMPGMDGLEAARRMRALAGGDRVTLIALTGWGQDEHRRQSQLAGFDYHLIKPADVTALQTLLTSLNPKGP